MQQAKPFTIDAQALATSSAPADRLVFVSHFVPYNLPSGKDDEPFAMTSTQIDRLARIAAVQPQKGGRRTPDPVPKRLAEAIQRWRGLAGLETGTANIAVTPAPTDKGQGGIGSLATEFGFLFLDRTRIRPMGFALGEYLTSISLAPGEEVTLEQRTYTKVEQSFEETRDQEATKDAELSSAYTNELSESLDWQLTTNNKSTNGSGGKVSGSYEGIGVEASTQSANDLTDGDVRTTKDSLKRTETSTRKIASKQRQQHKTVLRLSQENRFETGSKRIIRNANSLAPIDLMYFKIMQRLRLAHERYGVRLCWAPAVADPGGRFFAELERQREEFMAVATAVDVGPAPTAPSAPAGQPAMTQSVARLADGFDPVWGGQSSNYTMDIAAPTNYTWDGQPITLAFSFTGRRPAGARILTTVGTASGVQAIVHVGVADCRNPTQPAFWEATGTATISLTANFLPSANTVADQSYADKLAKYLTDLAEWQAARAAAVADAKARAETDWAKIRAGIVANANIVQEVMGALIQQAFPDPSVRDEPWELDLWQRIFDFDNVSVTFYPSWWSGRELRDATSGATSFLNASWSRVYVPIQPGAEQAALRWLLSHDLRGGSRALEAAIQQVVDDLRAYRIANFGGEDELVLGTPTDPGDSCPIFTRPSKCLGQWTELIPTDGTHIEVLQATTSAADDDLRVRLDTQNDLQQARADLLARDVEIKALVAAGPLNGLTSHVEIGVPDHKAE